MLDRKEIESLRKSTREWNFEQLLQRDCDFYNSVPGNLTGYDCHLCGNRGYIAKIADHYVVQERCTCMAIRENIWRIERSGLADVINDYTFEKYLAVEPWQDKIKKQAQEFLNEAQGWFFIGGQVGCGKTHICTAIARGLMEQGNQAIYMLWRDEATSLKAIRMNEEEYNKAINRLKAIRVLYIDDFFKTEKGKQPTEADINIAFELLNYRYNKKDSITILSSERSHREILSIDEAIGSRIIERCGKYLITIGEDIKKNYRLKRVV